MLDIYYASGWFTKEQRANYRMIVPLLQEKYVLFEPMLKAGEAAPNEELTLEKAGSILKADIDGIHRCQMLFADISFRDTGVLVEIGAAIERGMPIILFDNSSRPRMNCMLAGCATACLRNKEDIENWLDGKEVFNLGESKLQ